ncbi:MurR/RpiR family transcriptional regulator [Microbulbifer sp.]|uniref:MurR/RpiR family transcriptional regulator n=1 Tax=Microbulbifer sp. TaxID=1908541 RepID=UPI003F338F35
MTTEQESPDTEGVKWLELQERIKSSYPSMSRRLQEVAAYILENPKMVAFETIAVLAEQMRVPPSTLIRFASALGFSGFNELKNIVKEDLLDHTADYSNRIQLMRDQHSWHSDELLPRFAKANRDSLRQLEETVQEEDIRQAVEMMNRARHIFLLGNGRAHTVTTYLNYALNHIHKKVFMIDGAGGMFREQMSNVERGDLLLAVSYSPYSSNTCELAAEAANRGVSVLSITDSPVSPLANTSQLSFVVHEARVDAFRSLSASLLLAQVLAIALADAS